MPPVNLYSECLYFSNLLSCLQVIDLWVCVGGGGILSSEQRKITINQFSRQMYSCMNYTFVCSNCTVYAFIGNEVCTSTALCTLTYAISWHNYMTYNNLHITTLSEKNSNIFSSHFYFMLDQCTPKSFGM